MSYDIVRGSPDPKSFGEVLRLLWSMAKEAVVGGITSFLRRVWSKTGWCNKIAFGSFAVLAWQRLRPLLEGAALLDKAISVVGRVKAFVCGPRVRFDDGSRLNTSKTVMESVRAGSEEQTMTTPRCQVLIGTFKSGDFVAHGCGIRMRDFLVLPDHVFSYHRLDTGVDTYVMGRQVSKGVKITGRDVKVIDTDLVFLRLSPQEWSTIGASVQTLHNCLPERGAMAAIVGASGRGTQGKLEHDPEVFGRVVYDGTTLGGYSGAAYMVGNQIAGIHQSGGKVNGGYSASYVWITACFEEKIDDESIDDSPRWLMEMQRQKKRVHIDMGFRDVDRVRIRVNGQYHVVERSSMNHAYGSDWQSNVNDNGILYVEKSRGSWRDRTEESGEVASSEKSLGASSALDSNQGQEGSAVRVLTSGFKRLSEEEQREVIATLNSMRRNSNMRQMGKVQRKSILGRENL